MTKHTIVYLSDWTPDTVIPPEYNPKLKDFIVTCLDKSFDSEIVTVDEIEAWLDGYEKTAPTEDGVGYTLLNELNGWLSKNDAIFLHLDR